MGKYVSLAVRLCATYAVTYLLLFAAPFGPVWIGEEEVYLFGALTPVGFFAGGCWCGSGKFAIRRECEIVIGAWAILSTVIVLLLELSDIGVGWIVNMPFRYAAATFFPNVLLGTQPAYVSNNVQPLLVAGMNFVAIICFRLGAFWGSKHARSLN